ncbi:MAG: LamG-like jellyroll fold domain-containing protein [Gemmataceae bacterium]
MDADLRDLLAAWFGTDDAAGPRHEELLARLSEDADFRAAFVAELRMLGMLKAVQSAEPRWLRLRDTLDAMMPVAEAPTAFEDRVMRAAVQAPFPPRRPWLAYVATAVAMAAIVLALRPGTHSPSRPFAVEVGTVARAESIVGDVPAVGMPVRAGRLVIQSGRLTLGLYNGVTLAIAGPADIELLAVDRVLCNAGRLRADVPVGAEGFSVVSGRAEIVDLGADFGLNVERDGPIRLYTFRGRAAVSVLRPDGLSHRSTIVEPRQEIVIESGSDTIRAVPPQPDDYADLPDTTPTALELASAYPGEVIRSGPWGYWRFESLGADGLSPNECVGRPALRAFGDVRLDGKPGQNRCALFRPEEPFQAFMMDGEWTPPRQTGYAIETWVRADFSGLRAIVSLIARDGALEENHVALIELTARGDEAASRPCVVRFLDRWPPALAGGVNVFSRRSYVPDRWHHIVAQRNVESDELFIDGTMIATSPADPDSTSIACRLLVGRLKRQPRPYFVEIRPFAGRIDELAIYERPLSSEEIRRHYKSAGLAASRN